LDIFAALFGILLVGLAVGALARLAVPGPDPMPVWLMIALGVSGSFVGGFLGAVLGLAPDPGEPPLAVFSFSLLFSVIGATLLLVLFRRLVQKRPLTGPEAQKMPLRPRGLRRIVARRPHRFLEETANPQDGDPLDQLRKLVALRDAGKIDRAEFDRRKGALVERI
jgi:uncharacterized membrane protein YeaQ/YmgE (transglycosylase-associated protein family)